MRKLILILSILTLFTTTKSFSQNRRLKQQKHLQESIDYAGFKVDSQTYQILLTGKFKPTENKRFFELIMVYKEEGYSISQKEAIPSQMIQEDGSFSVLLPVKVDADFLNNCYFIFKVKDIGVDKIYTFYPSKTSHFK